MHSEPRAANLPAILGCGFLTALAAGCGGDGGRETPPPELPLFFELDATAAAQASGLSVDCALDYVVELAGEISRTDSVVEYLGRMGGEARRRLLRPDQSGVAFIADAFHEIQVLLVIPDRVQIITINLPPQPPEASSRFWEELTFFEGRLEAGNRVRGSWTCAPLDTEQGGLVDDSIFVDGAWLTTPIAN